MQAERRLAAIFSADAVDYTRLMADDDLQTVEIMREHRGTIAGLVRQYGGRVVDAVGDNLLAEFPSAVDAVQCAIEIQKHLAVCLLCQAHKLPPNLKGQRIVQNLLESQLNDQHTTLTL